jgi:signal transduction histidine kinase
VLSRCNPPDAIISTVKTGRTPIQPTLRVLHRRPTVRWRLTLLYSLLFLICGATLLAITYWLFANFAISPPKEPRNPTMVQLQTAMSTVRSKGLHRLQLYSGIALAIMTIVSVALGWLVAGRVLAPLRTITATADRISDTNLHERLAMSGPRDELRLLADTIDRLLARLEAAFDAQRRFVANASHELRTPLAMMRTTLDVAVAKPGGVPAQTRELDAELRVDLDDAGQLVESFLTLARAQNGQLDERNHVALEPLIRSALSRAAEQIAAKELTVETDLEAVVVAGSPTLLRRMIENVIENAVRHTKPGGLVAIALGSSGGRRARMDIANSGPVLDADAVAQLAQPFTRLSQDRTGSQDGHGLGLSIVAAVAAAHGGQLDLHAPPGGGLRVHITLPAACLPQFAQATP